MLTFPMDSETLDSEVVVVFDCVLLLESCSRANFEAAIFRISKWSLLSSVTVIFAQVVSLVATQVSLCHYISRVLPSL